jgi:hypothetical protein
MENSMQKTAIFLIFFVTGLISHLAYADATLLRELARTDMHGDVCHPSPEFDAKQYIVGYGSLMEQASRQRTVPDAGEAVPVRVQGFRRAWIARGSATGFSTTYLGVAVDGHARMNAVLFSLPDEAAVAAMDRRESGYCRVRIGTPQINTLDQSQIAAGERWIYVNKPQNTARPSRIYPIVQSYVDIFLSGCLEVERTFHLQDFARQCVTTTQGWSTNWVNDRIYPRRPFIYQPNAGAIDILLKRELPARFRRIRIE